MLKDFIIIKKIKTTNKQNIGNFTMEDKILEMRDPVKILINITLLDEIYNFKKISPFKIHKALDLISETWNWVKYTNNYQTLTITEASEEKLNYFLELNKIKINEIVYNIKTNKVLSVNHSKGVVYSKSLLTTSDEEILNSLKSQNVCEIYRFKKHLLDGTLVESGSFCLTFADSKRPNMLKISFLNLEVYPLLEKPMQCNHCFLVGHTMKRCKVLHEAFCKQCFHRTTTDQVHECIEICKNCRGTHLSNLKTCPTYVKEKRILEMKSYEQISYYEAKQRVNLKTSNLVPDHDHLQNFDEMEKIKSEKLYLEKMNQELKLLNFEQNTTIKLLSEENEKLKLQLSLSIKKIEINKNLTVEILSQLKTSTELNKNNKEREKNCDSMLEQYRKTCESSGYWTVYMKQFINQNAKTAKDFQDYMKTVDNN